MRKCNICNVILSDEAIQVLAIHDSIVDIYDDSSLTVVNDSGVHVVCVMHCEHLIPDDDSMIYDYI